MSREQIKFTFVSTNVLILTPTSKPQKPQQWGKTWCRCYIRKQRPTVFNISFAYLCFSIYQLFFQKSELKNRNSSSFMYDGSEAGSRSPTDVESWLNPACIKPSILDYLSKLMVTSAIAQKWILSVVCFVCLCVDIMWFTGQKNPKANSIDPLS